MDAKKIRNGVLASLMGWGVAFVILEVFLRIFNPFGFRIQGDRIILPAHHKYTIENVTFEKLDPLIHHTKNSLGFRGEEPPADLRNMLSILAVGGSTTECFYLSDGDDWPTRLAHLLDGFFSPFWLNNAGLNGHSTFGHLMLVEQCISELKPKVVLFLVGVNDVGMAERRAHDAMFEKRLDFSSPGSFVRSLARYSQVVNSCVNISRYLSAVKLGVVDRKPVNPEDFGFQEREPDEVREALLSEHRKLYVPAYCQRVEELIVLCRASGIEPIFITQSTLFGPGTDPVSGSDMEQVWVKGLSGRLAWERMELYNEALRRLGGEQEVHVVDLAAMMPRSSAYYYDWFHYTPEGAEKVAQLIFQDLLPYLSQQYPAFVSEASPD